MQKQEKAIEEEDDMAPEYDLGKMKGVRGKYAARFAGGSNLILFAPDVAKAFPDSEAVNEALRTLLRADLLGSLKRTGKTAKSASSSKAVKAPSAAKAAKSKKSV